MKKLTVYFSFMLLFSSCASVMNRPVTNTTIYTTKPSRIILDKDTVTTKNNKAHLTIPRQNAPLQLVLLTDSLQKEISVEPVNSFMYYYNLLGNYGLGMLVDCNNPKRYGYPTRVYVNSEDEAGTYKKYGIANNKGEVQLHLSLPHINSFYLKPENESRKSNTGFWGISAGIDYYHSSRQFVHISANAVSDFFVPVPAAVDISGEYELMSSKYLSLTNNHKLKRFIIGYGLSYAKNFWDFRYYDSFDPAPPTRDPVSKSNNTFGLVTSSYYQFGQSFHAGVIYRPTFLRTNSADVFKYEHLVSIDFAWKIRINKNYNH